MWLVTARLYLGDYRSGEEALAGATRPLLPGGDLAPFAAVVSLCPMPLLLDEVLEGPSHTATEWLKTPIADGGNGEDEFESALVAIRPFVRRRQRSGNVLVHCAAGMSRSVAVVAALLCETGATVEGALQRISEAKAQATYPFVGNPGDLIAPAAEFQKCLDRLYGPQTNRTRTQTEA